MPREIGLGNNPHVQDYDGDIDFDFFEDDDDDKRTKDSIPNVTPLQHPTEKQETTKDDKKQRSYSDGADTNSIEPDSDSSKRWRDSESENTFESDSDSENSLDVTVTESSSTSSSWSQDDSFASLSDDEITDVTPLSSTNASPLPASPNRFHIAKSIIARKKSAVKFNDENKPMVVNSAMNLDAIVQAILKLEQDRKSVNGSVGLLPQKERFGSARSQKNMSFTDEQVRKIDRENQLLLKKILNQQQASKNCGTKKSRLPRPPSSAINRLRQQRKIEAENLSLLRRIQSAKPTKELSRQYLLQSHDQLQCCGDSASVYVPKSNSSSQLSSRSVSTMPIPIAQSKIPLSRARVRSNRATQARSDWNAKIHAKS